MEDEDKPDESTEALVRTARLRVAGRSTADGSFEVAEEVSPERRFWSFHRGIKILLFLLLFICGIGLVMLIMHLCRLQGVLSGNPPLQGIGRAARISHPAAGEKERRNAQLRAVTDSPRSAPAPENPVPAASYTGAKLSPEEENIMQRLMPSPGTGGGPHPPGGRSPAPPLQKGQPLFDM